MATNTSNNTRGMWVPASQCIPWLVVFSTECLAIVILNIITIIVFVRQHELRRRSTYLIIHLAIVDLLVGAVAGPLEIEWIGAFLCDLWEYNRTDINWLNAGVFVLGLLFLSASLLNLAVISLERLHATFCPMRHRFIKKWVYGVIITVMWVISIAVTAPLSFVFIFRVSFDSFIVISVIAFVTNFVFFCFVICVSYIAIYIKVRCRRHPQHHGTAGLRERKLTRTLFLVTLGSLVTYVPMITLNSILIFDYQQIRSLSLRSQFNYILICYFFEFGNSLINPIIYAMQMPELRAGILQLIFRRAPNRLNQVDLPLLNL